METSILISKILSTVYLSFAFGILFNKKYYKELVSKVADNSVFMLFGGFLAIVFGFLILEFHNSWNSDWTSIITLVGWISLLKGIALLVIPKISDTYKNIFSSTGNIINYAMILMLMLGLVFGYFGFIK